jgi:pyridoxal phosphate enzyme (YggS family)
MPVAENIAQIQARIAAAAKKSGRKAEDIALMAVTKTVPPEKIREAYQAGLRVFGESRVQEIATKATSLQDLKDASWHMIGHLQSNKVAKAVELFNAVDSLDSLKLAERLNTAAEAAGKKLPVLIEINVGGEAAKTGLSPESAELQAILQSSLRLTHLEVRGLMTVPPFTEDSEAARPYFRKVRQLREKITAAGWHGVEMTILSMGMSHDFEIAIEEGSTCIRVGTAIFGQRLLPQT